MQDNKKKLFIIIFFISIAILAGVYVAFQSSSTNTNSSTTGSSNTYQSFNPFGNGKTVTNNTNTTNTTGINTAAPTEQTANVNSKFHKITDFAVSGATFFEDQRPIQTTPTNTATDNATTATVTNPTATTDTTTVKTTTTSTKTKKTKVVSKKIVAAPTFDIVPAIRYVERATGHIYEMYLDTKATGQISNSTIPTIYEALFGNSANSVIYRYLSDDNTTINSYMATLGGTSGEFLVNNIQDISLSPDKSKFFYLVNSGNDIIGITRSFTDNKKAQIFVSPYTEWLSQWVTDKTIYLTTKASSQFNGDIFSLNITTGALTKIFGDVSGLTTLSNNNGSTILYNNSTSSGPRLGLFDVNKHISNYLDSYGLPEKCVWSVDNINLYCAIPNTIVGTDYPDAWYQGIISFDDHFIKINTVTGQTTFIADSSTNESVDATHLFLNKDESSLFFINKKDSTLWSLDLN